jgi:hypothetical protein
MNANQWVRVCSLFQYLFYHLLKLGERAQSSRKLKIRSRRNPQNLEDSICRPSAVAGAVRHPLITRRIPGEHQLVIHSFSSVWSECSLDCGLHEREIVGEGDAIIFSIRISTYSTNLNVPKRRYYCSASRLCPVNRLELHYIKFRIIALHWIESSSVRYSAVSIKYSARWIIESEIEKHQNHWCVSACYDHSLALPLHWVTARSVRRELLNR